jgi:DNA invertase Pin-like site-specific DNA recombinase
MSSLAEFERQQLLERVNAGIAAAQRRGVHTGRPHALTPHQRSEAGRMAKDGKSCGDIAAHFNVSRMCAWRAIQEKKL